MNNRSGASGAVAVATNFSHQTDRGPAEPGHLDALESAIAATNHRPTSPKRLSRDQKAAIIMRLIMPDAPSLPTDGLERHQTLRLVHAMAELSFIDETTMLSVIDEFLAEFNTGGLRFKPGLDGALENFPDDERKKINVLMNGGMGFANSKEVWEGITRLDIGHLTDILAGQTPQVAAIALAKLPASLSAEILDSLEPEAARDVTLATAAAGIVGPTAVSEIGKAILALANTGGNTSALEGDASERISEILNLTPGARRQDLLRWLENEDQALADTVRRTMFTFADIPDRVEVKDIPKLVRGVDHTTLVTALAAGQISEKETAEFILANLSKRLSEQLAEEAGEAGEVAQKEADKAMNAVVQSIRDLENAGEMTLISREQ